MSVQTTGSGAVSQAGPPQLRMRKAARAVVQAGFEHSWLGTRLFWRMPPETAGVALTFDDGPDPELTPRILDCLAAYGAKATFFVVGEQAVHYPELVERIAAEGHAIGNHTFSHARCPQLTLDALWCELQAADAAIQAVCPHLLRPVFRPPYGAITPRQLWHLAPTHRPVALWSKDSKDYRGAAPAQIAAVAETLEARDIMLMHDRFPATVEALPAVLEALRRKGLATVTVQNSRASEKGRESVFVKMLATRWRTRQLGK